MGELAAKNQVFTSLIGQGYSGTILPAVIQRNILENPAWYTAYTPYQPEISQGRLEALFNFQTMICDLTGLDVANASLLDEATAAAEAMALAERASQVEDKSLLRRCRGASADARGAAHPRRAAGLESDRRRSPHRSRQGRRVRRAAAISGHLAARCATSGPRSRALHAKGALAIVAADLLALTLLASPGELGADIAIGSAQRFGVPMGYGGPHAAYMAVRDALKRSLPGRIVGLSVDSRGAPGLSAGAADPRAAYPPREGDLQHLHRAGAARRDRLDVRGLSRPRRTDAYRAQRASPRRRAGGRACASSALRRSREAFFDTVTVDAGAKQSEIVARALAEKINLRIGDGTLGIALDETTTPATVEAVWRAFGGKLAYARHRGGRARGACRRS